MRGKSHVNKDANVHMTTEYRNTKNRITKTEVKREFNLVYKSMLLSTALISTILISSTSATTNDQVDEINTNNEFLVNTETYNDELTLINNVQMATKVIEKSISNGDLNSVVFDRLLKAISDVEEKLSGQYEFNRTDLLLPVVKDTREVVNFNISELGYPELENQRERSIQNLDLIISRFNHNGIYTFNGRNLNLYRLHGGQPPRENKLIKQHVLSRGDGSIKEPFSREELKEKIEVFEAKKAYEKVKVKEEQKREDEENKKLEVEIYTEKQKKENSRKNKASKVEKNIEVKESEKKPIKKEKKAEEVKYKSHNESEEQGRETTDSKPTNTGQIEIPQEEIDAMEKANEEWLEREEEADLDLIDRMRD